MAAFFKDKGEWKTAGIAYSIMYMSSIVQDHGWLSEWEVLPILDF